MVGFIRRFPSILPILTAPIGLAQGISDIIRAVELAMLANTRVSSRPFFQFLLITGHTYNI